MTCCVNQLDCALLSEQSAPQIVTLAGVPPISAAARAHLPVTSHTKPPAEQRAPSLLVAKSRRLVTGWFNVAHFQKMPG